MIGLSVRWMCAAAAIAGAAAAIGTAICAREGYAVHGRERLDRDQP